LVHEGTHALSTQMRPVPQSELYLHAQSAPTHAGLATQVPFTQIWFAAQSEATSHDFTVGGFEPGGTQ
jgi:hypothetical protein